MGIEGTTMEFEPKMPPVALVEPQASVDYRRTREMTIDEILLENRWSSSPVRSITPQPLES